MTAPTSNPSAPTIETERLTLRAHRLDDLADCVAMWSDPIVTRYTIGAPSPAQRTWIRMMSYLGHWSLLGFGYWAVEEKASHRYIGEIGFADFKRGLDSKFDGVPELGWVLAPHAHGKGYATEALRAAVSWGDVRFRGADTFCLIAPENIASLRVAQKLGFEERGRLTMNGTPEIVLERRAQP